ncbi:hypothetical protein ABIF90_000159 [Bradyrhizobium japonicum]
MVEKGAEFDRSEVNITTLKPNENLLKLRLDLKEKPDLRKELAENPTAVLNKYGLSVDLPVGTIRRLQTGGGLGVPSSGNFHMDQHADGHLDINPHIDENPHIDLG